jgi:hypothetical protein
MVEIESIGKKRLFRINALLIKKITYIYYSWDRGKTWPTFPIHLLMAWPMIQEMNLCDASARILTFVSYLLVLCDITERVGEQEKKEVNEMRKINWSCIAMCARINRMTQALIATLSLRVALKALP